MNFRRKDLTDQQKLFLEHLFGEAKGNTRLAAEMAGYSPTAYVAVARNLKDEIIEVAKEIMASNAARAAVVMGEALGEGATTPGANVRLAAAEKVLDRVGITKKDIIELDSKGNNAIFILPAKKPVEAPEGNE